MYIYINLVDDNCVCALLQDMIWQLLKKTFRWKFIESLEPPRVVHVRQTDMMTKDNVYGQITVRLHVKQVSKDDMYSQLTVCLHIQHVSKYIQWVA